MLANSDLLFIAEDKLKILKNLIFLRGHLKIKKENKGHNIMYGVNVYIFSDCTFVKMGGGKILINR